MNEGYPWSTPVAAYGAFDGYHLWKRGESRWIEPTGEWAYGKFELVRIQYNVEGPGGARGGE